jgi:hypothetical protein
VHECPNCGFKPEHQSTVDTIAGELVEIGGALTKTEKLAHLPRVSIYAQLAFYGIDKGYAPGWAEHKFKEIAGCWPNFGYEVPPVPPSPELRSWIRSRHIAFAKRRSTNATQPIAA